MFNLPTFLNKAGEWMLNLGAGFQKAIGAEGDTFQQRLSGVGQRILETGAKIQEAIGGTGETLPERATGAVKTIVPATAGLGVFNPSIAKDITLEAPARAAGSLTLQATGQKQFIPQTGVEKFFLGEEPVLSIEERIANAIPLGELIGQKVAGKIGGEIGKGLAPVAVVGLTALDLMPFGGGKKTLEKSLLNAKTIEEASAVLSKAKVPQKLIEEFAPKFAKMTKIADVKNALKELEISLETIKKSSVIPKELEPLAEEARKYKSAEEFVDKNIDDYVKNTDEYKNWARGSKNIIEAYHGTPYSFDNFEIGNKQAGAYELDSISFATKKELAEPFSRQYPDWFYDKKKIIENKYRGIDEIKDKLKKIDRQSKIRSVDEIKKEGREIQSELKKEWEDKKDWLFNNNYEKFKGQYTYSFGRLKELEDELNRARNIDDIKITQAEKTKLRKYEKELNDLENEVSGNVYKVYIKGKNIIDKIGEEIGFGSTRNQIVADLDGDILRIKDADTGQYIGEEIIVNDPSQIFIVNSPKNKSQLTDIWNKAHKEVKPRVEPETKITPEVLQQKAKETFPREALKERGFVTSVKEIYPEMKVAGQYIPRSTDRLAIKAKNLIKDNIEGAEKIARTQTDDNAVAIGSELIKHYGDLAQKATDKATRAALNDRAAEIANDLARRLTAQGRSVQAASILGRLTPEGQVRFAAREIQKYNEMVERTRGGILGLRKKIPELTGEQADHILTEMKAIQNMAEGEEKAMRFKKLQDYISDLVPSPLYQKLISVWKAGLLTGIKTSGLNIFSNLTHAGLETIKDLPASAIDSVASFFTGKRTTSFTLKGIPQGVKEGFAKGWTYLKTGYSERDFSFRWDYKRVSFGEGKIAKALQKYEESVFRVVGSEDMPFYYGAKAKSLYSQAVAQAKNKGLKGEEMRKFVENLVQNPTDEMVRYAVLDAETAVFQQETVLGKIARQIQKAPGGEVVVPFGRTPSAVATQILNYSPVGIAKTIFENVGKGRFDQRLFSQGLARGLTGTGVLALGAYMAKRGLIETGRPTSEREQKLWELEGRKANSIKIDGKWRDVQVLGPAGSLLIVGAYFQKELEKTGSATKALVQAMVGGAKSFTEQTFLKGMSSTIDAITDPQRSAEGWFGSTLASTIPTIVSDIARATDIKERRVEGVADRLKARIPGLRQTLQPQITVLGKEKERVGSFLEVMADPTRPSREIQSPLILELRRLWNNGYKVSPTLLGDKSGYKVLTPEQNTELWKKAGEIAEKKLSNLIKSEKYLKLDDEQKAKIIDDFVDKSKLYARVEMVLKLTEGLEGEALIQKLKELKAGGFLTKQVFEEYQKLR